MPPRILRKIRRATQPARAPDLVYPRRKELLLSRLGTEVRRAELKLLVQALRNQPGVNVRQPSHQAPPIRSFPLDVQRTVQFNGATALGRVIMIRFVCPERHAGALRGFAIGVNRNATDATTWLDLAANTFFLTVNGVAYVPTTMGVTLGGTSSAESLNGLKGYIAKTGNDNNGGASFNNGVGIDALQPIMIPFFEGDIVEMGVNEGTANQGLPTSVRIAVRIYGWFYPQRATTGDRGVLSTLVD